PRRTLEYRMRQRPPVGGADQETQRSGAIQLPERDRRRGIAIGSEGGTEMSEIVEPIEHQPGSEPALFTDHQARARPLPHGGDPGSVSPHGNDAGGGVPAPQPVGRNGRLLHRGESRSGTRVTVRNDAVENFTEGPLPGQPAGDPP